MKKLLNAVYTGLETNLIGLHAKVSLCEGGHPCTDPNCDRLYARFDDVNLPPNMLHLASGSHVFYVKDFAIEDPESPYAPETGSSPNSSTN